MTEVSRIADSTMFKLVVPVLQTLIGLGAIGAFTYVTSSLNTIQSQLSNYQTNQAVLIQRVDSLERRVDASEKLTDSVRSTAQESKYQISSIMESIKNGVLSGRPK